LLAFGEEISITNDIRNELNRRRPKPGIADVVLTEPDDKTMPVPYMPRPFPKGSWNITKIAHHDNPSDHYLNPFFIGTDAWQLVEEWDVDPKTGFYVQPTGRFVRDAGYGVHWPDPEYTTTTLGCLRVVNKEDLLFLVDKIQEAWSIGDAVRLVVS